MLAFDVAELILGIVAVVALRISGNIKDKGFPWHRPNKFSIVSLIIMATLLFLIQNVSMLNQHAGLIWLPVTLVVITAIAVATRWPTGSSIGRFFHNLTWGLKFTLPKWLRWAKRLLQWTERNGAFKVEVVSAALVAAALILFGGFLFVLGSFNGDTSAPEAAGSAATATQTPTPTKGTTTDAGNAKDSCDAVLSTSYSPPENFQFHPSVNLDVCTNGSWGHWSGTAAPSSAKISACGKDADYFYIKTDLGIQGATFVLRDTYPAPPWHFCDQRSS